MFDYDEVSKNSCYSESSNIFHLTYDEPFKKSYPSSISEYYKDRDKENELSLNNGIGFDK